MNKILNVTETIFDEKRTELLELLDKADDVVDRLTETGDFSSVSENLQSQINTTRQRCHEGLFSIALIAAFQSGKSTTLNTFADGREIAPRGLGGGGVKTSACLVKVRNPDEGEEETVKVTWRSEQDLLLRLDEALGETACLISNSKIAEELRSINEKKTQPQTEEEAEKCTQQYYSLINFKTSEGRSLLEQALKKELEEYHKSQEKSSENVQDKLDRLRFAMIVLAYYDDPTLKDLQNRDKFEPQEIESYLKFPNDFEKRWNKCFNNYSQNLTKEEFSLQEVMYAFIEEVTYIVNSENLKKSGAQIVDCPGLFASQYDTFTALKAMKEASAIWFLMTGDKQLSQSEIKALDTIKQAGHQKKVFFGINYKTNPKSKAAKNVMDTILAQLKPLGFTASYQVEPLYFNAFLALRAMQGEKLIKNVLDFNSQKQIKLDTQAMLDLDEDDEYSDEEYENSEFDSVEEAWLESVKEVMAKVAGLKKVKRLSSSIDIETIKFVREQSQWDSATDQIKEYVFKTKAWSVLVNSGCKPVIETLEEAEQSLKIAEKTAHESLEKAQKEWDEAREKLALFQKESDNILKFYIDDNWEIVLAKNFWEEVYLPSIKGTGNLAAPLIADEATIGNALGDIFPQIGNTIIERINWFTDKLGLKDLKIDPNVVETLKERCAKIIRNKFEYSIRIKSEGWFNSLKKGGNRDYENLILRRVIKACNLLKKNWKDLDLNHNLYLQGLDVNLPEFSGDIRKDMEKYNKDGMEGAVDQSIAKPFEDIGIFFGAAYFLFLFDLVFPGLGAALFTVAVLAVVIYSRFKPRQEYIEEISEKITEELTKGVGPKQPEITKSLEEKLVIVRKFYSGSIQKSFELMSQQLDQRIQKSKEDLNKSQAERERIAEVAKTFRIEELKPLQQEMEQFKSSVEDIWKKPS